MDCSSPGSSVHRILQARILEWLPFSSPGDLPDPGTQASPCRASQNLPGVPELSQCKANVLSIALWCCVIRLPVSSRLSFQSFPAPLLQLCRPPCSSWNSSPGVPSMLLPHLLQALPEYHHLGETNIFVFPFSKYTLKITNFLFSFLALFFSIVKHNAI